jgi:hypothetical protein
VLDARPELVALSAADPELEGFDPATAVFIDTETTGLMGGAGTVAFLIGAGWFDAGAGCFRLEQAFMRDYDDEEPMLRYLDALFRRFETVVTYNGKTFDVPLLRTRCIQNRIPCRLDGMMHFDLVHAARRLWKLRLRDCSLGNVERMVLGSERKGDVPGHEIPRRWFDYLRTRDARPLHGVFQHHQRDILSLAWLTAWLSRALGSPAGTGLEHAEDRLSLVKLFYRQKRWDELLPHAEELAGADVADTVAEQAIELMALAHKRCRAYSDMAACWQRLLDRQPRNLQARIELAKYHEHRSRDLEAAARICEEAIAFLEERRALHHRTLDIGSVHLTDFRRRLSRIQRKRGVLPEADGLLPPDEEE